MSMSWRRYPEGSREPKHKELPFLTEARVQARADALDPDDFERIKGEARERAAKIMAEWEGRR